MSSLMKKEEYDLAYHIRPPKGLLNDPNGLIQYKGIYHVFYQWNQNDTTHQTKSWGHVTSKDLIHWKEQPAALEPTDWFDKDGCYSGSAIEADGELYLFYTGNVRDKAGNRKSYQCVAVSEDGIHFKKKGPILSSPPGYTAHIRDPKVWKSNTDGWWLILGAQRKDLTGDCIIYYSNNLVDWDYRGSLIEQRPKAGYMWECPDLWRFKETDLFVFSPQGLKALGNEFNNVYSTVYLSGKFRQDGIFIPNTSTLTEVDRGFEFYAPQTFVDNKGRRILFGWIGVMDPATEAAVPTRKNGWIHALSFPREVRIESNKMIQRPVSELALMRESNPIQINSKEAQELVLSSLQSELIIEWTASPQEVFLIIRDAVQLSYSSENKQLAVKRTNWLSGEREERLVYLEKGLHSLQLLIESSLIEIFINDGEEVLSLRYFTKEENHRIKLLDKVEENRKITLFRLNK